MKAMSIRGLTIGPLYVTALSAALPLSPARAQEVARPAAPATREKVTRLPSRRVWGSPGRSRDGTRPNVREPPPDGGGGGRLVTLAYGQEDLTLQCSVLRACVIELQAGEALVDAPIAGDNARWLIAVARTGGGGRNTLVVLKPKACNITTNLVLSTNRRIYDLDLRAPRCSRKGEAATAHARHVRFAYPLDVTAPAVRAPTPTQDATLASTTREQLVRQRSDSAFGRPTNFTYRVVRKPRGPLGLLGRRPVDFPWEPRNIGDDGAHLYITLPPEAKRHAAPVLYALEDDGSRTLLNFAVRDSVIITDRIVRRAVLVLASGKRERTLVFENRAWSMRTR